MRKFIYIGAVSAAFAASTPAYAEAGDILVKARGTYHVRLDGLSVELPDTDEVVSADVDDAAGAEASLAVFMTDNVALEVSLGATVYEVRDAIGGKLVSANLLMTSATVQYHVSPEGKRLRPYLGVGVTHLNLYGDQVDIALLNKSRDQFASYNARLSGGFAPVAQVGADIALNARTFVNIDAKYTARETEILIARESSTISEQRIGALVLGLGLGFKF